MTRNDNDVVARASKSNNEVASSSPDKTSLKRSVRSTSGSNRFPRFTNEASSNAERTDTAPQYNHCRKERGGCGLLQLRLRGPHHQRSQEVYTISSINGVYNNVGLHPQAEAKSANPTNIHLTVIRPVINDRSCGWQGTGLRQEGANEHGSANQNQRTNQDDQPIPTMLDTQGSSTRSTRAKNIEPGESRKTEDYRQDASNLTTAIIQQQRR